MQEEYKYAIETYQKPLDLDNNQVTTINGMAYAHFRDGDTNKAISYYKRSLNIESNNFDALSGLFTIYIIEKQDNRAQDIVLKLSEYENQVMENLIKEGTWLQQNGHLKEAQRLFDAAEKLKLVD